MNNAPSSIIQALQSGSFDSANLITLNLGDAYGNGDEIFYYTDYGHDLVLDGITYLSNNSILNIDGISRKSEIGSDSVEIPFHTFLMSTF